MKIIEFYGLPGSGKSTVCEEIIRILRDSNEKVGDINEYSKICKGVSWVLKGVVSKNGFSFFVLAIKVLWKRKLLFCSDVIVRFLRVIQFLAFYNECERKEKYTYLILDQAFIQGFISTFFDYVDMEAKDFECINRGISLLNFMSFYVDVSAEVASDRIN